jgi:excisionase family DNA binding protein
MTALLTTDAVAEQLDVSRSTVLRLVERGQLEAAVKLPGARGAYLFDPDAVEQYRRSPL